MVGILIVSHGRLADALISSVQSLVGNLEKIKGILHTMGKKIYQNHISTNQTTIDMSSYNPGVYFIKAQSNNTDRLNKVLDTDAGSRYIGEFALGLNPFILKPMRDALFDEKIMGSFHLTPGRCYKDADNGNESAVHWDLIYMQTPEYGGGEIYFDGALIRKDGKFVLESLKQLNPENLR